MFQGSEIFEKNYNQYCEQIAEIDFTAVKEKLGVELIDGQIRVHLLNREYRVSGEGITDASGNRPDYGICVILAKYLLLCPDQLHLEPQWVSIKDFKKTSHFTNVNFFTSDTEQVILKQFTARLDDLLIAGKSLGGFKAEEEMPYDLSMQFDLLPRHSLLLLFNDRDEEFAAQCTVLFQKHAQFYLDPESLIMTSTLLARRLKIADQLVYKK